MKKIFPFLILFLLTHSLFAQTTYYSGEWRVANKLDRFSGVFQIKIINGADVVGKLIWTYKATDSTSQEMMDMYKGKRNKIAMEMVEGTYNRVTGDINFKGIKKNDPQSIIGMDIYNLKLSADKKVLYGRTDDNGTKDGLFYGVKMDQVKGKKKFMMMKKKIR